MDAVRSVCYHLRALDLHWALEYCPEKETARLRTQEDSGQSGRGWRAHRTTDITETPFPVE